MNSVLVDTGPLYALVDIDDRHHAKARQQLAALLALNFRVIVLQPILMESYTLILHKLGRIAVQDWLRELSHGADLVNPSANDYEEARQLVTRYSDQKITLFDATLAILSKKLEAPVWTYDFHFEVMRIEMWHGL